MKFIEKYWKLSTFDWILERTIKRTGNKSTGEYFEVSLDKTLIKELVNVLDLEEGKLYVQVASNTEYLFDEGLSEFFTVVGDNLYVTSHSSNKNKLSNIESRPLSLKEEIDNYEQFEQTYTILLKLIGATISEKVAEYPSTLTEVDDVLKRKMLGIGSVISPSRLELTAPYKILKQYNLAGHKIDKILAMSKSGKVACLMEGEDKTIYIIERDKILASFECENKRLLGPTSLGFLGENTFYYSMYSTGYYGDSYGYALDINSGSQKSVTGVISASNKIARSKENESRYFIAGDTNAFVYDVELEKVIVSVGDGKNGVSYGGADVSSYGAVTIRGSYNSSYQTYWRSVNVISNIFETRMVYSKEEKFGTDAFAGINTTKPIYYVASKSGANTFKVFDSTMTETTELMTEIPVTGISQTPVFCTDKSGNLYLSQTKDSRSLTAIGLNGELIGFMKTPILPKNIGYVDDDTVCAKIGDGYCIATLQESPQYVII